jgi:hypothetical protein
MPLLTCTAADDWLHQLVHVDIAALYEKPIIEPTCKRAGTQHFVLPAPRHGLK